MSSRVNVHQQINNSGGPAGVRAIHVEQATAEAAPEMRQ